MVAISSSSIYLSLSNLSANSATKLQPSSAASDCIAKERGQIKRTDLDRAVELGEQTLVVQLLDPI